MSARWATCIAHDWRGAAKPRNTDNCWAGAGLRTVLFFGLNVDRLFGFHTFGGDGFGLVGLAGCIRHAFLEALDGAAKIFAHVAQLLGAENEGDDDQDDKPMPNAETTHVYLRGAGLPPALKYRRRAPFIEYCHST